MYAEDVTAAHSKMLARERTFIKRPTVGFDAGAGTSDSHATCGNFGHIKQVDTIKQNVSQSDDSFKLERGTTRKNTHSLSGEQGAGDEEDDVEAAAGLQEPSSFNQGSFSRQLPTEGRPAAINASFCPRPATIYTSSVYTSRSTTSLEGHVRSTRRIITNSFGRHL